MSAPGDIINQESLRKQIAEASDVLILPPGGGLRIHFDTQTSELSVLLPFIKKIKDMLSTELVDKDISMSIGGKVYPPRNGETEGFPKVFINLYRKVGECGQGGN